MEDLKIKTKTNIWVDKKYLKKFYRKNCRPVWVGFCEELIDKNFEVFVYFPEKSNSVYITIVKNSKMRTVRFSDHQTKEKNWLRSDVDYYVGPEELGMLSEKEVWDVINIYFR